MTDQERSKRPAETQLVNQADGQGSTVEIAVTGQLLVSGSATLEAPHLLHRPTTTVGRQDADINLDDPALSAHHFAIDKRDGVFSIRDLESTNGTRVNGQAIRQARLQTGDTIEAGTITFVFRTLQSVPWPSEP